MEILIKRKHCISFYGNGKIEIMKELSNALDLHPGEMINFAFDGGEFLIFKSPHGIPARKTKKGNSRDFRLYNKGVTNHFVKDGVVRYKMGESRVIDGVTYINIITR